MYVVFVSGPATKEEVRFGRRQKGEALAKEHALVGLRPSRNEAKPKTPLPAGS